MTHAPQATSSEVRPKIEHAVADFNQRAKTDPKMIETLKDMDRLIQLDVEGDQVYHFHLKDSHIDGVKDGPTANPQVLVSTDKQTLLGIFSGETSAMKAYMTKRIKFKATLMDLLVLKKLF